MIDHNERTAEARALRQAAVDARSMHAPVAPDCEEWAAWLEARADQIEQAVSSGSTLPDSPEANARARAEGQTIALPSVQPPTREQIAPLPDDARMDAYYYGFERTGVGFIDAILSAVAIAGKGAHHTESWGSPWEGTTDYFRGHPGLPDAEDAVDLIQKAAQQAADAVLALFPQPTPSTEPTVAVPLTLMCELRDSVGHLGGPAVAVQPALAAARAVTAVLPQSAAPAETVSIDDVALGTTFSAQQWGGVTRFLLKAAENGRFDVQDDDGGWLGADDIDPSTIRDITPPKGGDRG